MPVVPALGRHANNEFKVSLDEYIVKSCQKERRIQIIISRGCYAN
jgi:hypothetical protein